MQKTKKEKKERGEGQKKKREKTPPSSKFIPFSFFLKPDQAALGPLPSGLGGGLVIRAHIGLPVLGQGLPIGELGVA